jgi:D-inositol-3-phosphate glycosyltransferase
VVSDPDTVRHALVMSAGRVYGGAERSLVSTALRLPAAGWQVTVTCPEGPLAAEARRRGIAVVCRPWRVIRGISDKSSGRKTYSPAGTLVSLRDTLWNALGLTRLLRQTRPDVVVSNSLPTHLVVAVAATLARTPSVWYLRDIVDPGPGRRVLEATGRLVDAMVSISDAVTASIRHPRVVAVPDPIDPPPDGPPLAVPTGDRPVVGFLGRLDPRKGVEDVLRAAGALDVDVLVVGEPVLAGADYVATLRELGEQAAPGRVRFVGGVPDPWPALRAMDVLVVPSRREPWGRVAAEALCVGVPVVAAGTGGLPEIVRDGVDGLLYQPGDVAELVERLRVLLADGALARFRAAAVAGSARFDPDNNTRGVAAVLDSIARGRRAR